MAEAVPGGYNEFKASVIWKLPKTARVEIARESPSVSTSGTPAWQPARSSRPMNATSKAMARFAYGGISHDLGHRPSPGWAFPLAGGYGGSGNHE